MRSAQQDHGPIFSIGHSVHAMQQFLSLLEGACIDVVVDIRSQPYSKRASHFSLINLKQELRKQGMRYLYLGNELGGRPKEEQYYDENGYVLYSEWSRSALFLEGIERLEQGAMNHQIALMCSEENPVHCHRRLLVTPVLIRRGFDVIHIRGDGTQQSETDLLKLEAQPSLFTNPEGIAWKSTHSVLQRRPQRNSSTS